MHCTFGSFRLFVAVTAFLSAVFTAPAAQAQSVSGSGIFDEAYLGRMEFKVNVAINQNGKAHGTLNYRFVGRNGQWTKVDAVWLIVVGNQAVVVLNNWSFTFTDNGDGSIQPDYVNVGGGSASPLVSGDIVVTP